MAITSEAFDKAVVRAAKEAAAAFNWRLDAPPGMQLDSVVAAALPKDAALAALVDGLTAADKAALVVDTIRPAVRDRAKTLVLNAQKDALG